MCEKINTILKSFRLYLSSKSMVVKLLVTQQSFCYDFRIDLRENVSLRKNLVKFIINHVLKMSKQRNKLRYIFYYILQQMLFCL